METQNKLKTLLQEHFESEGLSEAEIEKAIENAMDSMVDDLNQLMESNEKIKNILTNAKEWQKSIEAWNKNKQGTNSEFKSIGTLIEVDSSDEQQIESLRKNTKDFNIDQKEAKAFLSMVNYDSSSFEFMFDIDNGNFVEIDKKNKKIIDVATSKNILGYLRDEIKYRIKEDGSESFTVEELFNANVLNNILEYINKEPRYFQDLNKVEKEAVISGYWEAPDPDMYEKIVEEFYYKKGLKEPEPALVQYPGDEWVSNYLSENKINFNTEYWNSIFEVVNRQENAFEITKKYLNEIDESKEYDEFQKSNFVKTLFNQLNQSREKYENHPSSYKELEILIKGMDAFEYGEDSLSFIRPDADDIENGFDNGWNFSEICKGYAEFADGYNESIVICRLDDMMIFDSDFDAALQAKKDGYQFLEVGKDIIFPKEMLNEEIEYGNYIDIPENRKILDKFLREDLKITNPVHITKMTFEEFSKEGFHKDLLDKINKTLKSLSETPLSVMYNTNELDIGEYLLTEDENNNFNVYFVQNDNIERISWNISQELCQKDIIQRIIKDAPDVYSKKYKLNDLTQIEQENEKQFSFGQFTDSGELKLIKDAKFKELVIDENQPENNKVIISFTENGKEKNLEMKESEYNKLLDAFNILEEQQNKAWEIQKYSQIAEKEPQKIFEEIKNYSFWGEDDKLTGYLKGLSKNNNIHHYLDELLFESCRDSDANLFCKVVDAGANISCRREEKGEPINILHYALHYTCDEKLSIYIKKIIEKTRTLTTEDNVELYSEQDFEGKTPFEVSLDRFDGKNYNPQSLLLDAIIDEGFSVVKDLLFVDRVGTKVLYSQNDDGSMQILCFDNDNNILNADFNTVLDEKSYGECLFEDLSFQLSKDGRLYNAQLNNNKELIAELKEIPQKLWDDSINYRMLSEIAKCCTGQDFYDFDSILELEKIKTQIFSKFDNRKELILQGKLERSQLKETLLRELNLDSTKDCELIQFLQNDNKTTDFFKSELVENCFEKKLLDLFREISPRPDYSTGMLKNNDCETFYLLFSNSGNFNKRINEDEAQIMLKYIQYENYNFYMSEDWDVCLLDVSEDFTGEGKVMSTKEIVDFAYEIMVKARDYEYACYDIKDEEVICNLRKQFSTQIKESVSDSKSTVQEFFSKLKDSLYENAPLDVILKSAGTVLQSFSETEKKEISLYLQNKGASSEDKVGKILSEVLSPEKQRKKRSDDFSPSL